MKIRILLLLLTQFVFGRFKMKTFVDVDLNNQQVFHTTWIYKFGICLLQSVKTFALDANGTDIHLSGYDFVWPMANIKVPFKPSHGKVFETATRAEYKMPLFGLQADCTSVMEMPQAYIHVKLSFFEGLFQFDADSMQRLSLRHQPRTTS